MTDRKFDLEEHILRGYSLLQQGALNSGDIGYVEKVVRQLEEARKNVLVPKNYRFVRPVKAHLRKLKRLEGPLTDFSERHGQYNPEVESQLASYAEQKRIHYEQTEEIDFSQFEISPKLVGLLKNAGVSTFGDLLMCSEQEILSIDKVGRKYLNDIKMELKKYGLSLSKKE